MMNLKQPVVPVLLILAAGLPGLEASTARLLSGTAAGVPFFPNDTVSPVAASTDGRYLLVDTIHVIDVATDTYAVAGQHPDGLRYGGAAAGGVSDDGRFVTWVERRNGPDIYLRDLQAGVTVNITAGADGASDYPEISADGRYVKYVTTARNLVTDAALLPPAGNIAVCLYDRLSGETRVAALTHDGKALDKGIQIAQESCLSADGRYLFYATAATNAHPDRAGVAVQTLVWIYRRDLQTGTVEVVNKSASGAIPTASFVTPKASADGNRVAFAVANLGLLPGPSLIDGYTNLFGTDIYLKDLVTGAVYRMSQTTTGAAPDGAFTNHVIGGNGAWVAFQSSAKNLTAGETDPAGTPGGSGSFDAFRADIGGDGQVTVSWLTQPAAGIVHNVVSNWIVAPAAGDYVAIDSYSWATMLGLADASNINSQTVGVGTFDFSATPDLTAGAADLGGGWWESPWFGRFWTGPAQPEFLYHAELGWVFISGTAQDLWLYAFTPAQWLHTGEGICPYLFAPQRPGWQHWLTPLPSPA